MRNLKLTLQYDGTEFFGWQMQPGRRTVQEVCETAVFEITRERIRLNASGRTDSGVHALGQVANFHTPTKLRCEVLVKAINAKLPEDVRVRECVEVPQSFCANKDAVRKLYRYVISDSRTPSPILRKYSWQTKQPLNEAAMNQAASQLIGRHDFLSFETEGPNRLSSVRTITRLTVERRDQEYLWLEVEADGFLYNMVRAIAGTLFQVGRGYWRAGLMKEILASRDRGKAGPTAPPEGLFLVNVTYATN